MTTQSHYTHSCQTTIKISFKTHIWTCSSMAQLHEWFFKDLLRCKKCGKQFCCKNQCNLIHVEKQPSWWDAAKGKTKSLVNIVADMLLILLLLFVEMIQYEYWKVRHFNPPSLLLKRATKVCVTMYVVMLDFYRFTFYSSPVPTVFRSLTVHEILAEM